VADTRFVHGANCAWFGPIQAVGVTRPVTLQVNGRAIHSSGLPCCPHCGGMLMESATEAEWWEAAKRYESAGHAGYVAMLEWARDKHFGSMAEMEQAYKRSKGD
jgi:hypothetical protein